MPCNGKGVGDPLVSIIIVNYNGAGLLRDCLDSVRRVTYANFEVILVDNASRDDSLKVLANYPWVKVIESSSNLGFTGGNNLGLRHSRGELVLLLNNDTVVSPEFLEILVRYLERHPEVGIAQGKMLLPRHQNTLDVCGAFMTPLGFLYNYGYFKPDGPKYQRNYPIFTAKGACLIFRRALIEKVGGYLFNEELFCYYEETDFCHRSWLAGYETHFVADAVIQHFMGATSDRMKWEDFPLRQFLRNQTFCLPCNLSWGSLLKIMPVYGLIFLASMLAGLCLGKTSLFKAHGGALVYCVKNLKKIRRQRRMTARIRKVDDRVIWQKVMRMPRLEYFWKTFQGQIRRYIDDELHDVST
jgi:GT2 family glycosyltransferase